MEYEQNELIKKYIILQLLYLTMKLQRISM